MAALAANIARLALDGSRRFPEAEAVVDGEVRLSYAELAEDALRATRAAIARGINHGDRVAIWAPNGHKWIVAALGALGAGAVIVPVNTRFKGAEAVHVLRTAGVRTLFADNAFLGNGYLPMLHAWLNETGEALPELVDTVVLDGDAGNDTPWEEFLFDGQAVSEDVALARIDQLGSDDLSDILFTSGTTGLPKGAMSSHGQVLRLFASWNELVGLREGDRYLVATPFFHTFGFKAGWVAALLQGATIVTLPVFDVRLTMESVEREAITFLPGPPALLQAILDSPERSRYDLSSLRTTVTGASDVPVELIRRLRNERIFDTIITGYGLTETNGPASLSRRDDDPETIANFAGRAMPGTELKVVGGGGEEVERGTPGEIVVRGFHVTRGYVGDPQGTATAIDRDGWFHTGDLGIMDHRGYVKITGRIKDMYNVGGFSAYPAEIENLLLGNEKIAHVAVIGVPDRRLGEVGAAFVVPRPGIRLEAQDVIDWARQHMANYKVPRYVEVCESLPVNALGKVLKDELRARIQRREA